ncbi:pum [Symbiodinium natans]|uniref:Pum protein n=1 Tax=Symbiodinium natans TaxID=878477 RepID=A0A812MXB8_9DINO|nr:pum [Symbiodinium natans]
MAEREISKDTAAWSALRRKDVSCFLLMSFSGALIVLRRGEEAAAESEGMALQSLHARLQARDVVRFAGGAEALERQVRETRTRAIEAVRPWIQLLGDRRQCPEVRKAMEVLLKETREEYESTLEMKTAKAEVVQELQDRASQQEWMIRQLVDVVEILEDSLLCTPSVSVDLELFFADVLAQPVSEELRTRAVSCLRALARCGAAAKRTLSTLGMASGSESAAEAEVTLEVTDTEASIPLGSFPLRLEKPEAEEAQTSPDSATAAATPPSPLEGEAFEEAGGEAAEAATAEPRPGGYSGGPARASQAASVPLATEALAQAGSGGRNRDPADAESGTPPTSPLDKVLDQLHVNNPKRMAPAHIYD